MSLVRRKNRSAILHCFQADIAAHQKGVPDKCLKLLFFFALPKLLNKKIVSENRNIAD
jgi:Tat protein secretion system quality control protein TatD with DNase activity